MACKKKLYRCRPKNETDEPIVVQSQRTLVRVRPEPADPQSLERAVRQLLADKVSGNLVGLWLLLPEHLRLGTWDLLCAWTGQPTEAVQPRLALQLVHEAALCISGLREQRSLSQKGFELTNGLPFLATDAAIHRLLDEQTIAESQRLQVALGKLRRASGHFQGNLLAIDPHRRRSWSKRQMRRQAARDQKPTKVAQTFFCLDADTHQPVCFTTATAARSAAKAAPELLALAAEILQPQPGQTLVLADTEHFAADLLDHVHCQTQFDLLVPMPQKRSLIRSLRALPEELFRPQWAGFSTATVPYQMTQSSQTYYQLVQRYGERADDDSFSAFLATRQCDQVQALAIDYPKRWHIEEFFNAEQKLGWSRAGTQNSHIRYGPMTMALIAQAVLFQLRQRLGPPYQQWDAPHLAHDLLYGLEGDIRVQSDTILVTFYNAPNAEQLRPHYEGLPERLAGEGIDPHIPWLYDFKLDFRFR